MNKLILLSFLVVCVGYAIAGYGSGTPGYYDPWTYYGGYERYGYRDSYRYPYYGRRGGGGGYPYYPVRGREMNRDYGRDRGYGRDRQYYGGGGGGRSYEGREGRNYGRVSYGKGSYGDDYDY